MHGGRLANDICNTYYIYYVRMYMHINGTKTITIIVKLLTLSV